MSTSADESTHISEASSQWHTTLHAVIFHLTEPRILLLAETDGWSVPAAHLAEPVWPKQAVGHLQEALRRALGLEATVLRCADFQVDEAARTIDTMYTVEHHCPTWTPPANGQWIDRATLATLPLARTARRGG